MSPGLKLLTLSVRIILEVIVIIIIFKLTTFGWRPSKKCDLALTPEENLTAKNLNRITTRLAQDIGSRNYVYYINMEQAAGYIFQSFKNLGYDTDIMVYRAKNQLFKNIIAQMPRTETSEQTLIIGAHYDSCFNPGADDNASGIAGLIELARLLKPQKLNCRVKFVAFANEEPPFFRTDTMGSLVYAKNAKQTGENIKAAIILESIGYYREERFSQRYLPLLGPFFPNRGNFITLVGNFASGNIVNQTYSHFKKACAFPIEKLVTFSFIPGVNFSDHWSFWQQGFPAFMITDTAFLRNSNYHQQSDLPETLNYEKMALVVHGLKEAIIRLSNE